MTIILSISIILLLLSYIKNCNILYTHNLVSKISQLRRDLIKLVHDNKINVDTEIFKFSYKTIETLLRIRYFKILNLLPSINNLFIIRKIEKDEKNQIDKIKNEFLEILKNNDNNDVLDFFKIFIDTMLAALIKNKVLFLLNLLSRIGFHSASRTLKDLQSITKKSNQINTFINAHAH